MTDEERGSRERGKQRIKKYGGTLVRVKEEGSEEGKEGRYLPPSYQIHKLAEVSVRLRTAMLLGSTATIG